MKAIIDTATDFNAVNGWNSGRDEKYDIEGNLESKTATLSDEGEVVYYGEAKFEGRKATDQVCFILSKCLDLTFMYVDKQDALDDSIGALFGFARPN